MKAHQYFFKKGIIAFLYSAANAAIKNIQKYGISETPYSLAIVLGSNAHIIWLNNPIIVKATITPPTQLTFYFSTIYTQNKPRNNTESTQILSTKPHWDIHNHNLVENQGSKTGILLPGQL